MNENLMPNPENKPAKVPFFKKRKFWKNAGIIAAIATGIAAMYAVAIEFWLKDLSNLTYLRFSYRLDTSLPENQQEVTITKVLHNTDYPSDFVIPKKILGRPVTMIAPEAFAGLDRLERVEMPDTIHTLGDRAFYNCPNLKTFRFSKNLHTLGIDVFAQTEFYDSFDDGFLYVGPILYTYKGVLPDGTALVPFGEKDNPDYSSYANIIELDDDLSILAPGLFKNQPGLVSVYLPDKIEVITRETFANNPNLTKVKFGNEVTTIAEKAFFQTPNLTEVTIPSTLATIGEQAFKYSGITGELDFPDTLKTISNFAFEGAVNVTAISLGAGITSIGEAAFRGCASLTTTSIDHQSPLTAIGREAFAGTMLKSITVPKNITVILSGVFRDNPELESVYLAEPFIKEGTTKLTGITSIRDYAFYNTPKLKTIATYDTTVEELTLTSPLNEVTLPSTVNEFGIQRSTGFVFAKSGITKITIPNDISLLPSNLFEDAVDLAAVIFDSENSRLIEIKQQAFKGTLSLETLELPKAVKTIGYSAFQNSGLVTFSLPEKVVTINESLFENSDALINITLPEGLRMIKKKAFYDCDALMSINIPSSVTHLYEHSFGNCDSLLNVNFDEGMNLKMWEYAFASSKLMTTAKIPSGVTEVAKGAFKDSPNITDIDWSLAPDVTRIGDFAFENNTKLVTIDIPETITSIGKDAFTGTGWYNAQPDGFVVLEHVLYRFKGDLPADGIIRIPEGVRVINEYCFTDARGKIKELHLPASVEHIGKYAFANNKGTLTPGEIAEGLTGLGPQTIVFAENSHLKVIDDYAFLNASNLTEFVAPNTLEVVGSSAFLHCTKLATLEFQKGSSLKEIKDHAIYDTPALKGNLYIPLNAKLGNYAFGSTTGNPDLTIHIANPLEDSYNTSIYNKNWNPHNIRVVWGSSHP